MLILIYKLKNVKIVQQPNKVQVKSICSWKKGSLAAKEAQLPAKIISSIVHNQLQKINKNNRSLGFTCFILSSFLLILLLFIIRLLIF